MTVAQAGAAARSPRARLLAAACAALFCLGFLTLGTWQLQRLQWKNALVAQVGQRVHAAPAAAPSPDAWARLSKDHDEYRHLRLSGHFLDESSIRVQASTVLGPGFWLLTPLRTDDGAIVIVDRGFIAAGAKPAGAGTDSVTVTGLLRMSERGGGFLRDNDPIHDRWYSRDVEAIAAARGLTHVAPYFVDQDAKKTGSDPFLMHELPPSAQIKTGSDSSSTMKEPPPSARIKNGSDPKMLDVEAIAAARGLTHVAPYFVDQDAKKTGSDPFLMHELPPSAQIKTGSDSSSTMKEPPPSARIKNGSDPKMLDPKMLEGTAVDPVGGLTVISFHNNHLVYALTWFAMALMAAGACYLVMREGGKQAKD